MGNWIKLVVNVEKGMETSCIITCMYYVVHYYYAYYASQKPSPRQEARRLDDDKYSLPRFCDRVIRVYCRSPFKLHLLQNVLREWTNKNGCPSPRGGSQSQVMM